MSALLPCPQLFDLALADNKFGRTGLIYLAKNLTTNTGLFSLDLLGHRINSEVIRIARVGPAPSLLQASALGP